MPDDKPRPIRYFLCTGQCVKYEDLIKYPDSHIIGHLCTLNDEGKQLTALARWEVSTPTIRVPPLQPLIDCMFIGDARNIRCRFPGCEHKERWEIGKAAFLALMSRYGKETID